MDCPDEEVVLALLDDELDEETVKNVEGHIDVCGACRRLLSSLAEPPPPLDACAPMLEERGERLPR